MKHLYTTSGVCSKAIEIDIEDGIIQDIAFVGGCHGNLQGISALVKGMPSSDVIARLEGINCRGKGTSCPAQLAAALRQIAEK